MLSLALTTAAVVAIGARASSQHCDPSYECNYYYQTSSDLWYWDFSSLCNPTEYEYKDHNNPNLGNLTYHFNVCGQTKFSCYTSQYENPYPRGAAVQAWGWAPTCKTAADKKCTDPQGNKQCCSKPCVTLGIGEPSFDVLNTKSPKYGGLNITHTAVPPDDMDPSECPYDPKTGGFLSRSVTYVFQCDKHGQKGQLSVQKVVEDPQCQYAVLITSKHGCASIYHGPDSAAAAGGLAAGMFFLGSFLTIAIGGGIYYYFIVHKKDPTFGGWYSGGSASYSSFGGAGGAGGGTTTAYGGASSSSSGGATAYSAVGA